MLYLDNSATTMIHPEVKEAMLPYLMEEYGNPSSKYYEKAINANLAVKEARESLASLLGCKSSELIFTSGATESNNMIIKGVADYYKGNGNHIITTKVEHPSVLETCKYLEKNGFNVTYLDVDQYGRINLESFKESIKSNTILATIMWGNNELGSLSDMEEIAKICFDRDIFLHTDATQVVGKIELDLANYPGITFLSCSAHKFHGPKGIGAAFVREDQYGVSTKFTPLFHGGGQEQGLRSGTLAVHNIVGMGKAAELALTNFKDNVTKLRNLEEVLSNILSNKFAGYISFNNDRQNKIPGIINITFKGVNNEMLLKSISPIIAASTGSACSSTKPSHVLEAIGLTKEEIRSTVRFSLSTLVEEEELEIFNNL